MKQTTEPVRIVTVGMGGYGQYLYNSLMNEVDSTSYRIVAGVDPYAETAMQYQDYLDAGIPIYADLTTAFEDLPAADKPELAIIASPIQFHDEQCRVALANGCLVLCEKPLTARWEGAESLAAYSEEVGVPLGVGFQWSYYPSILQMKKDLLAGDFGAVQEAKAIVVWPRYSDYYVGWKGQLRAPSGEWILDSVMSNATAHYLHNLLFLNGATLDKAALPVSLEAMTYRANPIPSFDTVSLSGTLANGAKLLYLATHAAAESIDPIFEIRCEKATLSCDMNDQEPQYQARFHDGSVRVYGSGTNHADSAEKIRIFIQAVRDPNTFIPCHARTAIPHLKLCNAASDQVEVVDVPAELITEGPFPGRPGRFVTGLKDLMKQAFDASLPLGATKAAPWLVEEQELKL